MLRQPGTDYEQHQSDSLLKYNPFGSDEAEVVIGHQPGAGESFDCLAALIYR